MQGMALSVSINMSWPDLRPARCEHPEPSICPYTYACEMLWCLWSNLGF